jgi:hypothetical protein
MRNLRGFNPAIAGLAATAAIVVVAASGCSSAKATSGVSTGTTSTSTAPAGAAGGPTTSSTLFASGTVPAVSGATDLKAEPTIAAGIGSPPAALTGKDLVVGTGATAGAEATVEVQYVGSLYSTGKVFDASWTDSGPATFQLSGVVPGFKDAIIGMKVGGRREIVIPPALGYGAAGSPPVIPPNSTLVFVIDLLAVS